MSLTTTLHTQENIVYDKGQVLPTTFNREDWLRRNNFTNGVIASQPDNTETNSNDPWLNYKPFDIYEFPTSAGALISMTDIESQQMIARFTNGFYLLNSLDV